MDVKKLTEIVELVSSMQYEQSKRDLILIGLGIQLGEDSRKEVHIDAETIKNAGRASV